MHSVQKKNVGTCRGVCLKKLLEMLGFPYFTCCGPINLPALFQGVATGDPTAKTWTKRLLYQVPLRLPSPRILAVEDSTPSRAQPVEVEMGPAVWELVYGYLNCLKL